MPNAPQQFLIPNSQLPNYPIPKTYHDFETNGISNTYNNTLRFPHSLSFFLSLSLLLTLSPVDRSIDLSPVSRPSRIPSSLSSKQTPRISRSQISIPTTQPASQSANQQEKRKEEMKRTSLLRRATSTSTSSSSAAGVVVVGQQQQQQTRAAAAYATASASAHAQQQYTPLIRFKGQHHHHNNTPCTFTIPFKGSSSTEALEPHFITDLTSFGSDLR